MIFYDETERIRALYNEAEQIWPKDDLWHLYVKKIINKYILKWCKSSSEDYILNAGSGGTDYEIKGMVCHLDIADKKILNKSDYAVGSIEDIPKQDNTFDYLICVGSVINYVHNIGKALSEFGRVLKPNGKLILEYERSNTAELLFTKEHGIDCCFQKYMYNGQNHGIWLYSDKLINSIMHVNNFELIKQYRFHSLSALGEKIKFSLGTQCRLTKLDKIIYPLSYNFAHNRISLWQKSF